MRAGRESAFESAYGPAGDWARLFRRVEGYVDTRLLADPEQPGRYVTVDRWTSLEAYETFRERLGEEYEALDGSFEELTEDERRLGAFLDLEGPGPA